MSAMSKQHHHLDSILSMFGLQVRVLCAVNVTERTFSNDAPPLLPSNVEASLHHTPTQARKQREFIHLS